MRIKKALAALNAKKEKEKLYVAEEDPTPDEDAENKKVKEKVKS